VRDLPDGWPFPLVVGNEQRPLGVVLPTTHSDADSARGDRNAGQTVS
jgi:hypothetical protein